MARPLIRRFMIGNIMGHSIQLTAKDGVEIGAYESAPEGTVRGGLVVVQEIFGVNHHIRDVADDFAHAGYHASITTKPIHDLRKR